MPNYITYSFEEILRWAVIVALVIPQDGHPLDPHWDKRLRDIVDDITGQQRSNFGLSVECAPRDGQIGTEELTGAAGL